MIPSFLPKLAVIEEDRAKFAPKFTPRFVLSKTFDVFERELVTALPSVFAIELPVVFVTVLEIVFVIPFVMVSCAVFPRVFVVLLFQL